METQGKPKHSRRKPPPIIARGSSHPNAIFNLPPKKIIKAIRNYKAEYPGELSFEKDDFFYVINDRPENATYEVINPILKLRGIVHYHCFNSIDKTAQVKNTEPESSNVSRDKNPRSADSIYQSEFEFGANYEEELHQHYPKSQNGYQMQNNRAVDSIYQSEFEYGGNDYQDEYRNMQRELPSEKRFSYEDDSDTGRWTQDFGYQSRSAYETGHPLPYSKPLKTPRSLDYKHQESNNNYQRKSNNGYTRDQEGFWRRNDEKDDDYQGELTSQLHSLGPKSSDRSKKTQSLIEGCTVTQVEQWGEKWTFVIHTKYTNNRLDILKRSYDDIWALQVTLLTKFPLEAGRENEARVIPFLSPPIGKMTFQEAQKTRFELNHYFTELLLVPEHVLYSPSVVKFFDCRKNDEYNASISFDVADTLLDLLEDYQDDDEITIKLVLGTEIIAWKEEQDITYEELREAAVDKLGFEFNHLIYMDECDHMIPLVGNRDFFLLKRIKKLKFFVC